MHQSTRIFCIFFIISLLVLTVIVHLISTDTFIELERFQQENFPTTISDSFTSALPNEDIITTQSNFDCNWPELKFRDPPGPRVALASPPGSGNTWVRHLIQLVSGYYTGSQYLDEELKNGGFLGEGITNGSVVAIKAHSPTEGFSKAIVIMRDPLSAAFSDFHRSKSGSNRHVSHAKDLSKWHEFAITSASKWKWFHSTLQKRYTKDNLCMMSYDRLRENLISELEPCMDFLGFPISPELEACILQEQEGNFHRAPSNDDNHEVAFHQTFSQAELEAFQKQYDDIISFYL